MSEPVQEELAGLLNSGLFAINASEIPRGHNSQMTLLVLGAPRGGTSAIAGALSKLNVFMGDGAAEPVFEGLKLAKAMEDGNRAKALDLIAEYNSRVDLWAHKRPGFTRLMQEYHGAFRNPVYLVIMRDPVATASRGVISGRLKGNHLKKLRQILQKYESIIGFVETSGAPAIFISYEKLLQEPRALLASLLQTLGIEADEGSLDDAVEYVEPSPERYLEVSRSNRTRGAWTNFDHDSISGWAEYVSPTMDQPPKIVLYDGEREVARSTATSMGEQGAHHFTFDLASLGIAPGPGLRVRAAGEIRDFPRPAYTGRARLRYYLGLLSLRLSPVRSDKSR